MYRTLLLAVAGLIVSQPISAQGLREVPQRFAHVQPLGLILGIGRVGFEVTVARGTTVELGGVGVYSQKDGIRLYGGGAGVGLNRFFGEGEAAGVVVGARLDGVWLQADNSGALAGFLSGPLRGKDQHIYVGVGGHVGYRFVSAAGWLVEPTVGYEYFIGPRPLVAGSRGLQNDLGITVGLAFGWAW